MNLLKLLLYVIIANGLNLHYLQFCIVNKYTKLLIFCALLYLTKVDLRHIVSIYDLICALW